MPWSTPTLTAVRSTVRDLIRGQLPGADANVPNSVLRVLSDNQGALCHLVLQYIDWLALQLMPDTAETEWLDRHGYIWLVNADGSTGRKLATPAVGEVTFTATTTVGVVVPQGTQLVYSSTLLFETIETVTVTETPTSAHIAAVDPGSAGNLLPGSQLGIVAPMANILPVATVVSLDGGTDQETDDELRGRILQRIREPPMGGDAEDFVRWTLSYPGVTRAWCAPLEMGIGTVTVRFMMDDLRASDDPLTNGFPLPTDVAAVEAYLDKVRPVAVKDFFVEAPIPNPIDVHLTYLDANTVAVRNAIVVSLDDTFFARAVPGQLWYRSWTDEGINAASGVNAYDLNATDVTMPDNGHMAVLGTVYYDGVPAPTA